MKLALCAYLHGSGGAERQITMLANAMANRGHEVHFLVLSEFNKKYEISSLVRVHDLTTEEKKAVHPIIGRYKALKRAYTETKPDCTIHYNLQSAYLTVAMQKKVYCKSIYSERTDPYDKSYNGLLGIVRNWCVKRTDGFMFQSEGARDFFDAEVAKRSVVIHNSVSVPVEKYPMPDIRDNRIVSLGRLHEQKNIPLLIDAFAKIANEFPECTLENYGDGQLRDVLQQKINQLGLTNRIKLQPARKDVFSAIRTARLFVLSSDYEGMPNALMEAMALGLPCVATDCRPGGARTLVEDGVNGYVVPRMNVDALADKMRYVLSHPEVANTIAYGGRKIAETHTEKITFDKWEAFVNKVVSEF